MVLQTRDDDESEAEIWTEIRIYKKLWDLKMQLPIEHSHVVGPVWSDLAGIWYNEHILRLTKALWLLFASRATMVLTILRYFSVA